MARSEKARELAAKQRAQIKAAKERKRNSDNPRDWGAMRQIRETYKITREVDSSVTWLMAGAFVVPLIVCLVIAQLAADWWWGALPGIMLGLTAAMWVLVWRAKKAAYTRTAGQMGATQVGLSNLSKKWTVSDPIAANKSKDLVFRAVGPGGIVLIGEGEPGRLKNLLATEQRKHEAVAYGVTVVTMQAGDKAGQTPTDKIAAEIKKLPKVMTTPEIDQVKQRLKALDALRVKAPIPHGPMPTTVSRRQMRGR